MEDRAKISVEIEEWVGIGVVYRINNGSWMSEKEFYTELKKITLKLKRICSSNSKNG